MCCTSRPRCAYPWGSANVANAAFLFIRSQRIFEGFYISVSLPGLHFGVPGAVTVLSCSNTSSNWLFTQAFYHLGNAAVG